LYYERICKQLRVFCYPEPNGIGVAILGREGKLQREIAFRSRRGDCQLLRIDDQTKRIVLKHVQAQQAMVRKKKGIQHKMKPSEQQDLF